MKKLLFIIITLFVVLTTNAQTKLSSDTLIITKNHIDYYMLHDSLVKVGCPTLYSLPHDSLINVLGFFDNKIKSSSKDIYDSYMISLYTTIKKMEANNIHQIPVNDYFVLEMAIEVFNQTLSYEKPK